MSHPPEGSSTPVPSLRETHSRPRLRRAGTPGDRVRRAERGSGRATCCVWARVVTPSGLWRSLDRALSARTLIPGRDPVVSSGYPGCLNHQRGPATPLGQAVGTTSDRTRGSLTAARTVRAWARLARERTRGMRIADEARRERLRALMRRREHSSQDRSIAVPAGLQPVHDEHPAPSGRPDTQTRTSIKTSTAIETSTTTRSGTAPGGATSSSAGTNAPPVDLALPWLHGVDCQQPDRPAPGRGACALRSEALGSSQVLVRVAGDLDLATVPAMSEEFDRLLRAVRPPTELVIDLSEVTFVGAGALSALLSGASTARSRKIGFRVDGYSSAVSELLDLTDTHRALGTTPGIRQRK